MDRPGRGVERDFGVGYVRAHRARGLGIEVDEDVYAPFGDDPLLLHEVTIAQHHAHDQAGLVVRVLGRQPATTASDGRTTAGSDAPRWNAGAAR